MAAAFGDKYFCTFMILEAVELKFIDDIIDKKGGKGLTPFYLLCEKGFRRKAKSKDFNNEQTKIKEGKEENDGKYEDTSENTEQFELKS